MSVVIFTGPTLSADDARAALGEHEALVLGPVSQGDVYRAAQRRPLAIGIIDGYFARVPAVWHKEILWALDRGVMVYGAASMGALRAAELHPFGMVGVGAVFDAFADGTLEDDDEVTLIHGQADAGHVALSDAMVNIRATIARAISLDVLSHATGERMIAAGKNLFYPERSYRTVVASTRASQSGGELAAELDRFEAWLPGNEVDQKRADALAMLSQLVLGLDQGERPPRVDFRFERTDAWARVTQRSGSQLAAALPDDLPTERLLDELRLAGGSALREALAGALARALALQRAERDGVSVSPELFSEAVNGFFRERGLLQPEQIQDWIDTRELDVAGFTRFMQRQSSVYWTSVIYDPQVRDELRDHLRTTHTYRDIVVRARQKQALLRDHGAETLRLEEASVDLTELLRWFFLERGAGELPEDLDLAAAHLGFRDGDALIDALLREHYFVSNEPPR